MLRRSHKENKRAGVALIAVLWVIAFMTSLLIVTLTLLKVDVDDNVAEVHSFRAWQLAHSGLSYGLHPKVKRDDPLLESEDDGVDEGYAVTVEPEATRLNINGVLQSGDKTLLFNLFKAWGLEDREVDQLVDALVDWTDGDELLSLNGAEKDFYRELGYLDRPYNRPFRELDEMPLVRGFGRVEDLKPDWREFFTVWSKGGVDIHEADPQLLAVLAEVDDIAAEQFHQLVIGEDELMGTEDDVKYPDIDGALNELTSPPGRRDEIAKRFTLKGEVLRVESIGRSGNFRYLIRAISNAKGTPGSLVDYQEKQLDSE